MTMVALVTGASSGIGRATAVALARAGVRVFGTVRDPAVALPAGVEPVRMDVRDEASVEEGVHQVLERAGRIDVLVNNAGAALAGAVEETGVDQAQALFDVNFFGAVRVTKAVLPGMRRQRSGRILFVSSVFGFLLAPFMGFYAASKHAIEGLAESLDHEVRTLGIRVLLVEPTWTRTQLERSSVSARERIDDYASALGRVAGGISAGVQHGENPATVAREVVLAATAPRTSLRHPVGKGARMLARLRAWLPPGVFDRSFRKQLRLDP